MPDLSGCKVPLVALYVAFIPEMTNNVFSLLTMPLFYIKNECVKKKNGIRISAKIILLHFRIAIHLHIFISI